MVYATSLELTCYKFRKSPDHGVTVVFSSLLSTESSIRLFYIFITSNITADTVVNED